MAKGKQVTVSNVYINNSKTQTSVTKTVEPIVVNGALVPDDHDVNPGVLIGTSQ